MRQLNSDLPIHEAHVAHQGFHHDFQNVKTGVYKINLYQHQNSKKKGYSIGKYKASSGIQASTTGA